MGSPPTQGPFPLQSGQPRYVTGHCGQCTNHCLLALELDDDDTVVNAYRTVPKTRFGMPIRQRSQSPSCKNQAALIGLPLSEARKKLLD